MKKNNCVLLMFDDKREEQFFETNLAENKFKILSSTNFVDAVSLVNEHSPALVVINVALTEEAIVNFSITVKREQKNISILSLHNSELIGSTREIDHHLVRSVRPKLLLSVIRDLMNQEDIQWLPAIL